ncbi:FHA domain-containing protein [Stigmatella sp. ncwal1]|uniref:FHA domain-containing protein n=1 Tax=Stigmatella ashevillensis TaxID=2995309 RepID=A0ABT5D565_9BACT|nr:FHA domain-containing protein [Stigmatella ashevillena]MDC0708806.1 FHA domain-containing protein [Stigmatella ashevillena]
MGVRLLIARGPQEGQEISFEEDEVRIGRAAENEIVLHEQGVSRRHLRIASRGGRHFVTELGSANGTLHNGRPLSRDKEQELRGGDRLVVGPVEFVFTPLAAPRPVEPVRAGAPPSRGGRPGARLTRAQTEQEMRVIEAEDTGPHRAVTEEVAIPALPASSSKLPGNAPTLIEMPLPLRVARPPVQAPPRALPKPVAGALSAAERARLRRQMGKTLGGQLRLGWAGLSPRGKVAVGVGAGLLVGTLAVMLLSVFRPDGTLRPLGPEPSVLSLSPLPDSFGLGEGVVWTRSDLKAFDFEFVSPTRAVVVLHYQASDVSQEEVSISLNGVQQGWVPPDTTTSAEREIEQILAIPLLKRSELNQIVFDNVRNPPAREGWQIWNVYVEVIPVPELPSEQLLAKARQEDSQGLRFYGLRDVGSDNLFKAWKYYRSAWLTLEALEEKPEFYQDVRHALLRTGAELDHQCRRLVLDFQRSVQFRDGDRARATVEEVKRRFPTTEHRCHNLVIEKALQYGLPM